MNNDFSPYVTIYWFRKRKKTKNNEHHRIVWSFVFPQTHIHYRATSTIWFYLIRLHYLTFNSLTHCSTDSDSSVRHLAVWSVCACECILHFTLLNDKIFWSSFWFSQLDFWTFSQVHMWLDNRDNWIFIGLVTIR